AACRAAHRRSAAGWHAAYRAEALAHRASLPGRPSHSPPAFQRRASALEPQPGHRRAHRHGHAHAGRRSDHLSRPREPFDAQPTGDVSSTALGAFMTADLIYHITTAAQWKSAQAAGAYRGDTLES